MFREDDHLEKATEELFPNSGAAPPSSEETGMTNPISLHESSILKFLIPKENIPQSTRFENNPISEDMPIIPSTQQAYSNHDSFQFQIQEIDSDIRKFDKDEEVLAGTKIIVPDNHYQVSNSKEFSREDNHVHSKYSNAKVTMLESPKEPISVKTSGQPKLRTWKRIS